MIDKEIQKIIELTVRKSIAEFKKNGLLKDTENVAYSDASAILSSYYKTDKKEASITYAIQGIRFDPYARIIPMYYDQGKTLETIADPETGLVKECEGDTGIYIYPGYKFKCMDGLITNFHLPESTLIMLVSAFAGKDYIMEAYKHAVEERYKFFSFGDAMFIQ